MTARVAAERVQTSKQPFRLNPRSARERRIVHMTLKDMPSVRTESIGVGEHRQVVIHPAETKPSKSSCCATVGGGSTSDRPITIAFVRGASPNLAKARGHRKRSARDT